MVPTSPWWKNTKIVILMAAILIGVVFIVAAYIFHWDWTGFSSGESGTITIKVSQGTITATEVQPAKDLWDWLLLLGVLAIPVVVGLGAAWYTAQQGKVSSRENTDSQREAALQEYINKMSDLLEKNLRKSQPEEETRLVARARTLNLLRQLNPGRKGNVIQFLYESHLLSTCIIDLSFIELSEANLYRAQLNNAKLFKSGLFRARLFQAKLSLANLSEAYSVEADLRGAKLCYTDLTGANLRKADLRGADLREAKLKDAKLQDALYNKRTIQMKDPQGEELLSLKPTRFPDGFNCDGMKYVDCYSHDKPEVCQVKQDQPDTADTEILIDLSYTNLSYTDLSNRNFSNANFYQATLIEANLSHTDLKSANLREADLSGTILSGASITLKQLEEAKNTTPEQLAEIKSLKLAATQEATMAQSLTIPFQSETKPDQTSQKEVEQQEHTPPGKT